MKAYALITGFVFGLIVVMHVARAVDEGAEFAAQPWFIATTALAVGLCVWGLWLFARLKRS